MRWLMHPCTFKHTHVRDCTRRGPYKSICTWKEGRPPIGRILRQANRVTKYHVAPWLLLFCRLERWAVVEWDAGWWCLNKKLSETTRSRLFTPLRACESKCKGYVSLQEGSSLVSGDAPRAAPRVLWCSRIRSGRRCLGRTARRWWSCTTLVDHANPSVHVSEPSHRSRPCLDARRIETAHRWWECILFHSHALVVLPLHTVVWACARGVLDPGTWRLIWGLHTTLVTNW